MADEAASVDLVTVRFPRLPVRVHARTSEHSDELMREFTYLRAQSADPDAANVPTKLLDLVDELSGRYSGFTAGSQAELDAAMASGQSSLWSAAACCRFRFQSGGKPPHSKALRRRDRHTANGAMAAKATKATTIVCASTAMPARRKTFTATATESGK